MDIASLTAAATTTTIATTAATAAVATPFYSVAHVQNAMSLVDPGFQHDAGEIFNLQPAIKLTNQSTIESLDSAAGLAKDLKHALSSLPNEIDIEELAFGNDNRVQIEQLAQNVYNENLRQLSDRTITPEFNPEFNSTIEQDVGNDSIWPSDDPAPY